MGLTYRDIFVRAIPQKISITETYTYNVQVQKFVDFRFKEASGEIKIEYLYDGAQHDSRWKLRSIFNGFLDRSIVLKDINRFFNRLFNLRWLKTITRLLGLRYLAQSIRKLLLGPWQDDKYFGAAALSDALKWGKKYPKVGVGFMVFQNLVPPNFSEKWPEHRAHKLELPLDHIKQRLERSQKYTLKFNYTLEKPETPPVYLPPIRLTDQSSKRPDLLHTRSDEVLNLTIPFQVYMGRPHVDDAGKVDREEVIRWWQEANKDKKKEKDEYVDREQIEVIKTNIPPPVSTLTEKLMELAKGRGGYLLIYVTDSSTSNKEKLEKICLEIKKRILLAAFESKPMVPVFAPYMQKHEKKPLFVVPVPMVPPRWYEDRMEEDDTFRDYLYVLSRNKQIIEVIPVTADNNYASNQLARIMASFANSDGGNIFLDSRQDKDWGDLYNIIREARFKCHPPISREILEIHENDNSRSIHIKVAPSSPEVHLVENTLYSWEQNSFESVNLSQNDLAEDDIDEIYTYIRDRCKLELPTIEDRPVISFACLKGPNFDTREHYGAQYDPQRKILRWDQDIVFVHNPNKRLHYTNLNVTVNRPIELYSQPDLEGEVTIDFNEKLISGLDITYFNALGEQVPIGGKTVVEKKSKVKILFDHITLQSIFQHQFFRASRVLQFEGIKPDFQRVNDIQGMLADLGLDEIRADLVWRPSRSELPLAIIPVDEVMKIYDGYKITAKRPDGLWIKTVVTGELANVNRERQEGSRIDRTRVKSGWMRAEITGTIEGDLEKAQELSDLLNHFQRLLKERFSNVRVQIA